MTAQPQSWNQSPHAGRWVGAFVACVGIGLIAYCLWSVLRWGKCFAWNEATGTVLSSRVERMNIGSTGAGRYRAVISVRYTVNGTEYRNDAPLLMHNASTDYARHRRTCAKYPPGLEVAILYSPVDSKQSVIKGTADWFPLFLIFSLGILAAWSGGYAFLGRQQSAYPEEKELLRPLPEDLASVLRQFAGFGIHISSDPGQRLIIQAGKCRSKIQRQASMAITVFLGYMIAVMLYDQRSSIAKLICLTVCVLIELACICWVIRVFLMERGVNVKHGSLSAWSRMGPLRKSRVFTPGADKSLICKQTFKSGHIEYYDIALATKDGWERSVLVNVPGKHRAEWLRQKIDSVFRYGNQGQTDPASSE